MQPCRKIQKIIRQLDENNEQLQKEKVLTWAQNKELTMNGRTVGVSLILKHIFLNLLQMFLPAKVFGFFDFSLKRVLRWGGPNRDQYPPVSSGATSEPAGGMWSWNSSSLQPHEESSTSMKQKAELLTTGSSCHPAPGSSWPPSGVLLTRLHQQNWENCGRLLQCVCRL